MIAINKQESVFEEQRAAGLTRVLTQTDQNAHEAVKIANPLAKSSAVVVSSVVIDVPKAQQSSSAHRSLSSVNGHYQPSHNEVNTTVLWKRDDTDDLH